MEGNEKAVAETSGCALEIERSTCLPESTQFELRRSEFLGSTNLSDLRQFWWFFNFIFP